MPIQRTYTGRSSSPISPSSADTSGGVGQLLMRANENRQYREEKNEDRYLKYLDVSPETYIANKNTEEQAKMLEDYNKKAEELLKQRGNSFDRFTTQDWVYLQQERNKLEAVQEKMNTDLLKFTEMKKIMESDKAGKQLLDQEEWNKTVEDYLNTGVFPEEFTLPIKSKPFTQALAEYSSDIYTGEAVAGEDIVSLQNIPHKRPYTVNITEDQARGLIKDVMLGDDAARKDLINRFESLPIEEKAKWLIDENNDSGIDSGERENGIIRWAQNNPEFLKAAQVRKYGTPTPIRKPSTGGGVTSTKGTPTKVAGATVNMFPGQQIGTERSYGGKTYSKDSFGFGGNTILYGIPTKDAQILTGEWADNVDPGTVNGRIVLYDPQKHVFLLETSSASESAMTASRVLLEIPEASIQDYQNIPVEVGGRVTKVGELTPAQSTPTVPTPPTNKWEKYLKK